VAPVRQIDEEICLPSKRLWKTFEARGKNAMKIKATTWRNWQTQGT